MGNRGDFHLTRGEHVAARGCLEGATALMAAAGHEAALGAFSGSLALLLAQEGDLEGAQQLAESSEQKLRRFKHTSELGKLLCKRGQIALLAADRAAAEARLVEAEAIALQLSLGPHAPLSRKVVYLREALQSGIADVGEVNILQ